MNDPAPILRVGLSGGIASGKTMVAQLLADRGAVLIDADVLARRVVEPGTPGLAAIVARFGPGILRPDGTLDRASLGDIIFADEQARADLNAIVHPAVRAAARADEAGAPSGSIVVHVIPLLVETGHEDDFDVVVMVDVDEDTQIRRLMRRNQLSDEQARARVAAQASRAERTAVADLVIDNSGSMDQTRRRVAEVWGELLRRRSALGLPEQPE